MTRHETRTPRRWPLYFIGASASVAVWSGWVGLGEMCGFGIIHPLPGIWSSFHLDTAITLPIGVEAYGAYALGTWLSPHTGLTARNFARRSAIGSLTLGVLGQVSFHLLSAFHMARAPWEIIIAVSSLPVITLGFAAALMHLTYQEQPQVAVQTPPVATTETQEIEFEAPLDVTRKAPEYTAIPGTVSVRNPISRLDRKIPANERSIRSM